jgi:antitoxin VapB
MSRSSRKRSPVTRRSAQRPDAGAAVAEAKLFMNGRSQAVRLPAAYRFAGDSVYVKRWRGAVILLPKRHPWAPLTESLGDFSADFMAERVQPAQQERPGLDALFD